MKFKGILCIALFLALITASAVSATPSKNSEMPTNDQFEDWISGFSGESNFVDSAYDSYIQEFPKCHVDKIESNGEIVGIVFYTYDPSEGAEGYDSHYYDAKGDKMGIGCDGSFKLVDSYKGEGIQEKEEVTEEDEKEEAIDEVKTEKEVSHKKHKESAKDIGRNIIKKGMIDEGKKTYEDLGKALDKYNYEDLGKALDKYKRDLDVLSINTASASEYLINENGVYLGDSDGNKLKIHNNRYAHNPTYGELMDFLDKNDIDKRDYEFPTYTCGNFAVDLHDAAEKKFIRAGIVCALNDDGNFNHAFNMFETVDNGTVFIDCTSGFDGENDMGDCIVHINAMDGYTITSIDNPEESITYELRGTVYYEYYW